MTIKDDLIKMLKEIRIEIEKERARLEKLIPSDDKIKDIDIIEKLDELDEDEKFVSRYEKIFKINNAQITEEESIPKIP